VSLALFLRNHEFPSMKNWRNLGALASLCLLLSLGVAMNAQSEELDVPSIAPEGEKVLPANSSFAADCLLPWNDLITKSGWVLGVSIVTQSERWGEVLRVDFKIPGEDLSPLVNRLICWRTAAGHLQISVAIGQNVPPLHKPT
jgi:hypothetical protein